MGHSKHGFSPNGPRGSVHNTEGSVLNPRGSAHTIDGSANIPRDSAHNNEGSLFILEQCASMSIAEDLPSTSANKSEKREVVGETTVGETAIDEFC